jgi:hypothetical protein
MLSPEPMNKKDLGASATSAAKAAIADTAEKIKKDLEMSEHSGAKAVADNAAKIKKDIGAAGSDLVDKAGDVAAAAQDAMAEMRRIIDAFASRTGAKANEALETVKTTGVETADHVGAALSGASALGREGIDGVAEAVAKRPMTSMAVALGVGLLVGLASRGGSRA